MTDFFALMIPVVIFCGMVMLFLSQADRIDNVNVYYNKTYSTLAVTVSVFLLMPLSIIFSYPEMSTSTKFFTMLFSVYLMVSIIFEACLFGFKDVTLNFSKPLSDLVKRSNDLLIFGNTVMFMKDGVHVGEIGIRETRAGSVVIFSTIGRNKRTMEIGTSGVITKTFSRRFIKTVINAAERQYIPVTSQ